ncbi:MAG: glycosyltransferase family 1 protein [Hyphomicrobiales bacterium]|nr:glycosyltransferase family 1 protein [Hyphomicrobiales bacterium]
MTSTTDPALRILHVLRAPVGGLFRHVCDLTREQVARGHKVGLVTDSITGGDKAREVLGALEPDLALGLTRLPIHRLPHPNDLVNAWSIQRHLANVTPDVVHGHGSKGGLYARMLNPFEMQPAFVRAYTPHGGSLHYRKGQRGSFIFVGAEALLAKTTDLFLFESNYIRKAFDEAVGLEGRNVRVVLNGLAEPEFEPVVPDADAADFVYVGELRIVKGIEMVIHAIDELRSRTGVLHTLSVVGTGAEEDLLREQARRLGLGDAVRFHGLLPARKGLARGRILVAPSRIESLPYVLLEAAAGQVPIVATSVGGVPEILGPFASGLVAAKGPAITDAMHRALLEPGDVRADRARVLADYVRGRFKIGDMADSAISGYRDALAAKGGAAFISDGAK